MENLMMIRIYGYMKQNGKKITEFIPDLYSRIDEQAVKFFKKNKASVTLQLAFLNNDKRRLNTEECKIFWDCVNFNNLQDLKIHW